MPGSDMDAALRRALQAGGGAVPGCDAELAAAYAEGRLHGAERQRLEAHLAECDPCRRLSTILLEERLEAEPRPRLAPARSWWRWQWAAPAMASVVIVASVVYYQREQVVSKPLSVAETRPVKEVTTPPPAAPVVGREAKAARAARRDRAVGRPSIQGQVASDELKPVAPARR